MVKKQHKPDLSDQLQEVVGGTGMAVVGDKSRTFVVVEVTSDRVLLAARGYDITDPDEIAAIVDALDDTDNPTLSHDESLLRARQYREEYIRKLRELRGRSKVDR